MEKNGSGPHQPAQPVPGVCRDPCSPSHGVRENPTNPGAEDLGTLGMVLGSPSPHTGLSWSPGKGNPAPRREPGVDYALCCKKRRKAAPPATEKGAVEMLEGSGMSQERLDRAWSNVGWWEVPGNAGGGTGCAFRSLQPNPLWNSRMFLQLLELWVSLR